MHTLYVMRHGQAESSAPSDEQRALTPFGVQQVRQNAQKNLQAKVFDYVFVSPYLRAQQTWDIIHSVNIEYKQLHTVDWITPDVATQPALDQLFSLTEKLSETPKEKPLLILLVCHQTFAGRFITHLCGGARHGIHVDTGAIVNTNTEVFAAQCGTLIDTYNT
jgi:phosphohistidine phosphatase